MCKGSAAASFVEKEQRDIEAIDDADDNKAAQSNKKIRSYDRSSFKRCFW